MEKIIVTSVDKTVFDNFVSEKSDEIIKYIKKNANNGLNKTHISTNYLLEGAPFDVFANDVIEIVCECVVSKLENVSYKRSTPHWFFVFIVN